MASGAAVFAVLSRVAVADQFRVLVEAQLADDVDRHAVALQDLGLSFQILGIGRTGAAIQGKDFAGRINLDARRGFIDRPWSNT